MATGKSKSIASIEIGDQVAGTDPATGLTTSEAFTDIMVSYGSKRIIELYAGESSTAISATAEHPIWIDGRGWTNAVDVGIDDRVLLPGGTFSTIKKVKDLGVLPGQVVFNLSVGGVIPTPYWRTTKTPVVVRNSSCGIYTIQYENGTRYAGRSINVAGG